MSPKIWNHFNREREAIEKAKDVNVINSEQRLFHSNAGDALTSLYNS